MWTTSELHMNELFYVSSKVSCHLTSLCWSFGFHLLDLLGGGIQTWPPQTLLEWSDSLLESCNSPLGLSQALLGGGGLNLVFLEWPRWLVAFEWEVSLRMKPLLLPSSAFPWACHGIRAQSVEQPPTRRTIKVDGCRTEHLDHSFDWHYLQGSGAGVSLLVND